MPVLLGTAVWACRGLQNFKDLDRPRRQTVAGSTCTSSMASSMILSDWCDSRWFGVEHQNRSVCAAVGGGESVRARGGAGRGVGVLLQPLRHGLQAEGLCAGTGVVRGARVERVRRIRTGLVIGQATCSVDLWRWAHRLQRFFHARAFAGLTKKSSALV